MPTFSDHDASFIERRFWEFDDDDDDDLEGDAPSTPQSSEDEPTWLGFLKAVAVGLSLVALAPVVLFFVVLVLGIVLHFVQHR